MAKTVIALRLRDRTVTQTDIAPSWMSAAAMADAVIEARIGMSMGSFQVGGWAKKKRPGIAPRALFLGVDFREGVDRHPTDQIPLAPMKLPYDLIKICSL